VNNRIGGRIPQGLSVVAAAVLLLAGCFKSSSPTEPKVTATPTQTPTATATPTPSAAGTIWANTIQVVSSNPNNCVSRPVGEVGHTTFELQKNGSSIVVIPSDIFDFPTYRGTVSGTDFSATSPLDDLTLLPCGHGHFSSSLSGRLSTDGNHLTATEVWTYTFDSGTVATITFSWTANRL